MMFSIAFVVFASCVWQVTLGTDEHIGQGFYIPNYDLLGADMTGGYQIFHEIPKKCIEEKTTGIVDSSSSFFSDSASFYQKTSTETSIAISINSLGVTLDATTNSVSGTQRSITGLTYTDLSETKETALSQSCLPTIHLEKHVVSFFEKLPASIHEPRLLSAWTAYDIFLKEFGSHFVTHVSYGSSLYQHEFTKSSASFTENDYKVKACADLSSTSPETKVNVSICSGVTKEQMQEALQKNIEKRFVARGGSIKTRTELYTSRSSELIAKFLAEAENSDQPIAYKFTPIWKILSIVYQNTIHYPKVINLRAYYTGFLGYPCHYIKEQHAELQNFRLGPTGSENNPVFQCIIPYKGCQSDQDCKFYGGWTWYDDCFCRNDQCVTYKTITLTTGVKRVVAYLDPKGWDDSVEGGCLQAHNSECKCTTSAPDRVVWSSESYEATVNVLPSKKIKDDRKEL